MLPVGIPERQNLGRKRNGGLGLVMPAKLPFGLDAHRNFTASLLCQLMAGGVLGEEAVRNQSRKVST